MKRLVQFPITDGGTAMVEIEDEELGVGRAGRMSGLGDVASATLEDSLHRITPAANAVVRTVSGLDHRPEEVEVAFGIRLSADHGAVISTNRADAHFEVRLVWRRESA